MILRTKCFFVGLVVALLGANVVSSYGQTYRAELYTMGPGDDLFTKFGHAALCVTLPDRPPTMCFNYGTTDFSRPVGLTIDVLRGRAEFFVSVVEEGDMLGSFQFDDRTIYHQALPLSEEQVLRLAANLINDAQPDNRGYVYDHFLDNCSTKPRDLIDDVLGGVLRTTPGNDNPTSYRRLVDEQLGYSVLLIAMSDLFLGRRLDRPLTPYETMFLPKLLREAVKLRIGSEPETVYTRKAPLPPINPRAARRWIWLLLLAFAVAPSLALVWGSRRSAKGARIVTGLALGGLGTMLFLMAVASPEAEIRYNENLLVFLPTDLLLLSSRRMVIRLYLRLRLLELVLVGALAVAGVLLQPLGAFWLAASAPLAAMALGEKSAFKKGDEALPERP